MIFVGLASTSTLPTLPSSFSGTSFDTSSVSCASASSQKRALRQPMRLAGQLRLGCVSDRGLTMLMKVFCTWPNGFFFVPLLFLAPLGGLEGLDAMLYGRSCQKSLFFFSKQQRQVVERCSKMIPNELLCCLWLFTFLRGKTLSEYKTLDASWSSFFLHYVCYPRMNTYKRNAIHMHAWTYGCMYRYMNA